MSTTEMNSKVQQLRELRRMADELAARFMKQSTTRRFVLA